MYYSILYIYYIIYILQYIIYILYYIIYYIIYYIVIVYIRMFFSTFDNSTTGFDTLPSPGILVVCGLRATGFGARTLGAGIGRGCHLMTQALQEPLASGT